MLWKVNATTITGRAAGAAAQFALGCRVTRLKQPRAIRQCLTWLSYLMRLEAMTLPAATLRRSP